MAGNDSRQNRRRGARRTVQHLPGAALRRRPRLLGGPMMLRHLGLILVGGITTLALAACGGTATPSPSSSAASGASTAPSVAASTAPSVAASAGGSAAAAACTTAPAGGTAKVTVTIKDFSLSPEPVPA